MLTQRTDHAARLAALLEHKVRHVFLLVGSDKPRDRREKLAALQAVPQEEEVVIVATGRYIGEGFDVPRLDTLLLAMPISWKGTLTQYAGRLHRNYEGKREVRIYDYVDLQVPILERMYHRRLKGYAELGYQVKFGAQDESVSAIYDPPSALAAFDRDPAKAVRNIVIVSPYLQKGRVAQLLPSLQSAMASGVEVGAHTRDAACLAPEEQAGAHEAGRMLEQAGIAVVGHSALQQRYGILDERVVWYGSAEPAWPLAGGMPVCSGLKMRMWPESFWARYRRPEANSSE